MPNTVQQPPASIRLVMYLDTDRQQSNKVGQQVSRGLAPNRNAARRRPWGRSRPQSPGSSYRLPSHYNSVSKVDVNGENLPQKAARRSTSRWGGFWRQVCLAKRNNAKVVVPSPVHVVAGRTIWVEDSMPAHRWAGAKGFQYK